jgi:thymidylate kinase
VIINVRGNNGSGKSTLIKAFLSSYPTTPLFGVLGLRYPEAYKIDARASAPLYVLGPYHSKTGGVDALAHRSFDVIIQLLDKYAKKGHLLFEGVIISTSFGAVGEWIEKHKAKSIVAFLDTPLDVCVTAVGSRTGDAARSVHMQDKADSLRRVRARFLREGFRVEDISREDGFAKIRDWLA